MEVSAELSPGARLILEAATEAFSQAGYDSVSIADIATHAKVSKANIFHHFKSKESLYLEVMREACKGHAEFTESLLARTDMDSTEKLRQLINFEIDDLCNNEQRAHLVIREVFNNGCQTGRTMMQPVFLRNFTAVVGLIQQGQESGEFRANLDPAVTAVMIGSTVMMLFQNREMDGKFPGLGGRAEPAIHAEKVYQIIFNGLGCPSIRHAAASGCKPLSTKPRKRVPQ